MTDSSNINILNKVLDVLELLASQKKDIGVSEISRQLQAPKSGIFRILNTLKDRGYVYQNPATKSYGLGLNFYFLGVAVQNKLHLTKVAKKILDPLCNQYNECFYFAIPHLQSTSEPSIITIYATTTNRALSVNIYSGMTLPAHNMATGICILSSLSNSDLLNYIDCNLSSSTKFSINNWNDLNKEIENTRENGFCILKSTLELGIAEIAVPVYDTMSYPIGAMGICAPIERLQNLDKKELLRTLKRSSQMISNFSEEKLIYKS